MRIVVAAAALCLAVATVLGAPTLSADLSDNPFFEAHKDAVVAADRTDEPWDLAWALPDELRDPAVWRACVAGLPPASLRGTRSTPEPGVNFVGWPPVAN